MKIPFFPFPLSLLPHSAENATMTNIAKQHFGSRLRYMSNVFLCEYFKHL
ncbi:hypothetical protein HMPREF6485_2849 [Segatella buccae ATCC 33574]|uniref:Uncharacterized protein n=1 Tax=Segatella buccae ATCC 33574 TaxID=873513 RepID=E6KB62_9BACT|nr:hypothetical protein HMPREF0649_02135 [Segatella buccae D17]EFU29218.1 hypothetical protein HMPREF6485_2849 [Segatella buccae ATCC 33574]